MFLYNNLYYLLLFYYFTEQISIIFKWNEKDIVFTVEVKVYLSQPTRFFSLSSSSFYYKNNV